MQSLKDKLIEAGLIAADHRPGEMPEKRAARLNKEQAERRQRVAKVVQGARMETKIGGETFFFTTRSRKLRRLVIEADVRASLEKGDLAVVECPDHPDFPWAVVPRAAAERVLAIDPDAVRFWMRSEKERYGVAEAPAAR